MTPSSTESFFSSSASEEPRPWVWRCHDGSGADTTPPSGAGSGFPTQADAESWLGEAWQELLEEGVESVTLLEGERVVYGPMGLRA